MTSDLVQVALVHNPLEPSSPPPLIATVVQAILSNLSPGKAWPLVASLLEVEDPLDRAAILRLASEAGVGEAKMDKLFEDEAVFKLIQDHVTFSSRVLKLEPGQTALLSNGKVGKHHKYPLHNIIVSFSLSLSLSPSLPPPSLLPSPPADRSPLLI